MKVLVPTNHVPIRELTTMEIEERENAAEMLLLITVKAWLLSLHSICK